jgi:hypothetical protein
VRERRSLAASAVSESEPDRRPTAHKRGLRAALPFDCLQSDSTARLDSSPRGSAALCSDRQGQRLTRVRREAAPAPDGMSSSLLQVTSTPWLRTNDAVSLSAPRARRPRSRKTWRISSKFASVNVVTAKPSRGRRSDIVCIMGRIAKCRHVVSGAVPDDQQRDAIACMAR